MANEEQNKGKGDTFSQGQTGNAPSQQDPAPRAADLPPQAQPPNPPVDTTVDDNADEGEQFRQQQSAEAALQGQPGAVPEQRPAAFQEVSDAHQSSTFQALKESGHPLASNEPMPKEAYDRADSDEQRRKADRASRVPTLRDGERVRITKKEPGLEGRNAVIIQVHYSEEELQRREAGRADAAYAEASSYVVRTRDGRTDTLELKPDEVEAVSPADWGWGGI